MESMLDNLINGNCSEAKKQAKRHSLIKIKTYCSDEWGMTQNKAWHTAAFLKGEIDFQTYCDSK
jgi:hypothetical protein